jgi:flagellar hook-length control protein FliK
MGSELRATPNAGPAPQAAAMAGSAVAEGASGNPAAFASAVPGKAAPAAELRRPTLAGQVSVHISKALRDGTDRIDIQLKPASLGRVDVRLEITPDGRVHAAITADSRHALDLLRGDSRELERALQDAGFKADSGSLSFGLRGQDERQAHGGGGTAAANQAVAEDGEASDEPADDAESPANIAGFPAGRLDIRA